MSKKVYKLLLLFILCGTFVSAQNISVASFKLLENDLTANTAGTMERDQNGETAALIKVVTTEQGFVFDGGMVGIVKTKQGVGEVWVYVPHGIKKITVQHPQLGVLRDYYFPTTIEKAKTYEMVLTTGKVETIVTHSVNKQFVVFNVTPSDAVVELNDEMLTVDGEGYAEKGLPFGTYNYRVSCANYHTEAGQVTLNAQGKAKVNVTLRPNFGFIKFDAANEYHGADVYINDERVGQVPYLTKKLKSGTYKVKVMKSMYKTYEQEVVVSDNKTVNLNIALHPNFGYIQLDAVSSLYGADVYINNEKVGRLPFKSQQLLSDTYRVKIVKSMYKPYEQQVKVTDNETIALNVELIPNFANVTLTTDAESEIWIDDNYKSKGRWSGPLELGEYSVEVKKKSHRTASEIVRITEIGARTIALKAPTPIYASLELTSTPSNATVALDGKYVGETPLILNNILVGDHTVTVTKQGFSKVEKTIELKEEIENNISVVLPNTKEVSITSNPTGADVYIDGVYKGVTPLKTILSYGEHTIRFNREGYYQETQTIEVGDNMDLVTEKLRQIVGKMKITSSPSGALVYIDGVKVGQTPLMLDDVIVGSRKVILKKAGYESYEKTLVLSENTENILVATLEAEKVVVNGAKKTYKVKGVSFTMVDVEGGSFTMGATSEQGSDAYKWEKPVHKVTLSNYAIGETEVTQALWQAVMGSNPSRFTGDEQRPVEQVSWNDCQTFIKKLNQLTGENFRLPTEAEWEYAARGGKSSRGYKYSGGNNIDDVAWYTSNSSSITHVVKTKKANELGIYDMSGNVWEWCSDWYGEYSSSAQTNPKGPYSGSSRIIRGGGFINGAGSCRVSLRGGESSVAKNGLRLAL